MVYETIYNAGSQRHFNLWVYRRRVAMNGLLFKVIHEQCRRVNFCVVSSLSLTGYYMHRVDGPAMIDYDSGHIWFILLDYAFFHTTEFCDAADMSDEETLMWVLRFGDNLPKTCEEYYGAGWKDMAVEEF